MGGVAWTEEEDHLLRKCIEKYGEGKWHRVPLLAGLNRCRKSCRLRWLNYLRPNIKRGNFTQEEIDLIIKLHRLLGNRWSLIAARLPGRTSNDVKNYWNCHLSKRVIAQETEEKQQITRNDIPETSPKSPEGPSYLMQPHAPNVEITNTKSCPLILPIQHPDEQHHHQAFQKEENCHLGIDKEDGFCGDFDFDFDKFDGDDFEFGVDNFHNQYEWDDLILDMDF